MADTENKATQNGSEQSVDDILAEILNKDGSFREDFNDRFSAYLGESASQFTASVNTDLSDRRGEMPVGQRVEFEEPSLPGAAKPDEREELERRVNSQLPENVREVYEETSRNAKRPGFSPNGSVLYPTLGSGASGERVVYDADWEEKAKSEAARIRRVREDRMLRGDSAYVRSFVNPNPNVSGSGSLYIDPLSEEKDTDSPEYLRGSRNEGLNSFFLSGPPVSQRKNNAADGRTADRSAKTERSEDIYGESRKKPPEEKPDWLQVVDKNAKKKKKRGKRQEEEAAPAEEKPARDLANERFGIPENAIPVSRRPEKTAERGEKVPERRRPVAPPEEQLIRRTREETADLKVTVADIVDKYNRRSEEEEAARAKEAEERALREAEEKRLEEERRRSFSEDFLNVIDSGSAEKGFDEYEDITSVDGRSEPDSSFVFDAGKLDGNAGDEDGGFEEI